MMKLYYAYLADYDSHRSIAICDSLELAKQRCQEYYSERKHRTRETFSNRYLQRIGQEKVYFPKLLKWDYKAYGYAHDPIMYWVAEFPCEGTFSIREIGLNEAIRFL